MNDLKMIKFRNQALLMGIQVPPDAHPYGEKFVCFEAVLAVASFQKLHLNADNLLEEITDADRLTDTKKAGLVRSMPMMHIPDEAITTTNSVHEALEMKIPFNLDDIFLCVPVTEGSLMERFYTGTVDMLKSNKKLQADLFATCSTNVKVIEGVYDEKKTKKYFKIGA